MPKKKMYATIVKLENGVAIYLNGRTEYSTLHKSLDTFYEELHHLIDWGYEVRIKY